MLLLQFFIEAGLRGQMLRKTSLCGEKCTGNKPKWHWEVQLSSVINGAYASWMCLVPLPCWLPLLRAGSCLPGLAWSSNLNLSTRGWTLTGRRRRRFPQILTGDFYYFPFLPWLKCVKSVRHTNEIIREQVLTSSHTFTLLKDVQHKWHNLVGF